MNTPKPAGLNALLLPCLEDALDVVRALDVLRADTGHGGAALDDYGAIMRELTQERLDDCNAAYPVERQLAQCRLHYAGCNNDAPIGYIDPRGQAERQPREPVQKHAPGGDIQDHAQRYGIGRQTSGAYAHKSQRKHERRPKRGGACGRCVDYLLPPAASVSSILIIIPPIFIATPTGVVSLI